jgi:hypothetical protein
MRPHTIAAVEDPRSSPVIRGGLTLIVFNVRPYSTQEPDCTQKKCAQTERNWERTKSWTTAWPLKWFGRKEASNYQTAIE